MFARNFNLLFTLPIEMMIAIIFLGSYVNTTALTGVLVVLVVMPLTIFCVKTLGKALS
jgi:hypothetical protein